MHGKYNYQSLFSNINNKLIKKSRLGFGFSYFKKGSLIENFITKSYKILKSNEKVLKKKEPFIKYEMVDNYNIKKNKKHGIIQNEINHDHFKENYNYNFCDDYNKTNKLNISKYFPMKKINYFSNYSTHYISNENQNYNENENLTEHENLNEDNNNDIDSVDKFNSEILEVYLFKFK